MDSIRGIDLGTSTIEAEGQIKNGIELEFPANDKFAMSMFGQIQRLMQEQDYDGAVKTAEEGLRYYRNVECFLYMYARCSILNGNPGKAVKAYEKLVKRYPDKIYYRSELAKAYQERGYMRKAYDMFRKVYEEGWRESEFLCLYGLCCYDQKKYDEAVQIFENLIDSIPSEKIKDKIPELLMAYTGLFAIYEFYPFPIGKVVDGCSALLEQADSSIQDYDYENLMLQLHCAVTIAAMIDESEEIRALADEIEALLPDISDGEELEEIGEAYALLEDERFSHLMKFTVEAFMLLDDADFPDKFSGEYDEYAVFIQLDAFLCQLEVWPEQKEELKLLRKEYPLVYECGSEIWDMLKESRRKLSFIKEEMLAEYRKMERKYHCGHYYELYPDRRQDMKQAKWDSQGDGTYIRQDRKIGRNEPCPCGSGRKYKNCCGKGAQRL